MAESLLLSWCALRN